MDKSVINQVHWLNDEAAFSATLRLAADEQIFAGNSSGSAYWIGRWLKSQRLSDDNVVIILPDRGDRYHMALYNDEHRAAQNIGSLRLPIVVSETNQVEELLGAVVGYVRACHGTVVGVTTTSEFYVEWEGLAVLLCAPILIRRYSANSNGCAKLPR